MNPFTIEKKQLTLGFMPLNDSAPLIMAKELGIFSKWGLDVTLEKQASWSALRDKLHCGELDAAQMLAPMPISSTLGLTASQQNIITPLVLSQNGNAITLSENLYQQLMRHSSQPLTLPMSAEKLQPLVKQALNRGSKLRFATVYPYSCHYYQLRSWLVEGGIYLDDIDIVFIPPTSMRKSIEQGDIDGFCVGSPWNTEIVRNKLGMTCATSLDIWKNAPEKVLGLRADWQLANPETTMALVAALIETCNWLASIPNRYEAAVIMTQAKYLDTALDVIAPSLIGSCLTYHNMTPRALTNYNLFSSLQQENIHSLNLEFGNWLLKTMIDAGHISWQQANELFIGSVFRFDIYQAVTEIMAAQQLHQKDTGTDSNKNINNLHAVKKTA
ncbi:CmpA/NrtA family ABC transporter substrate-binding protein [Paraferrimonas sp. SM1919]|uniref:CmpA/NrtA family ABC transporter substrate-binding protein n=1 Tax=Paraferrimonas sp. SM1919 TaxID=2662263 RepID=UPI0013D40580|nr:CmpA/NrtA family ABC transporter substrate-binding protein [Paraferrimonas sp. SM1919]